MRRVIPIVLIAIVALSQSALAKKPAYGGGAAGSYQRPANAVRAKNKNVEWARTISSTGGVHVVTWKVKGKNELRTSAVDSKGKILGTTTTAVKGRILGLSSSGKSAIIEVKGRGGKARTMSQQLGINGGRLQPYTGSRFLQQQLGPAQRQKAGRPQARADGPRWPWLRNSFFPWVDGLLKRGGF